MKFLKLILHIAQNDGYDSDGTFKYHGRPLASADIISLVNNAVTQIKIPHGEEQFIQFLKETKVDPDLVLNQVMRKKILGKNVIHEPVVAERTHIERIPNYDVNPTVIKGVHSTSDEPPREPSPRPVSPLPSPVSPLSSSSPHPPQSTPSPQSTSKSTRKIQLAKSKTPAGPYRKSERPKKKPTRWITQ